MLTMQEKQSAKLLDKDTLNPFNYTQSILKQTVSKDLGVYALDARHASTSEMKKLKDGLDAAKNLYQV